MFRNVSTNQRANLRVSSVLNVLRASWRSGEGHRALRALGVKALPVRAGDTDGDGVRGGVGMRPSPAARLRRRRGGDTASSAGGVGGRLAERLSRVRVQTGSESLLAGLVLASLSTSDGAAGTTTPKKVAAMVAPAEIAEAIGPPYRG